MVKESKHEKARVIVFFMFCLLFFAVIIICSLYVLP